MGRVDAAGALDCHEYQRAMQRRSTVRQTSSAAQCNVSAYNFTACDLAQPPSQTWNSGGLLYGQTTLNGSAEVWSLYYGNRWSVSTVAGEDGIGGPFVDVGCMPAGSLTPGLPARPVPSYRLRNGSLRGFWQGDWPHHTEPNCTWREQTEGTRLGRSAAATTCPP